METQSLCDVLNKHAPCKQHILRSNHKPSINREIFKTIMEYTEKMLSSKKLICSKC